MNYIDTGDVTQFSRNSTTVSISIDKMLLGFSGNWFTNKCWQKIILIVHGYTYYDGEQQTNRTTGRHEHEVV